MEVTLANPSKIQLEVSLNTDKSITEINRAIDSIESSSSLKTINLKVNIDQESKDEVSDFFSSMSSNFVTGAGLGNFSTEFKTKFNEIAAHGATIGNALSVAFAQPIKKIMDTFKDLAASVTATGTAARTAAIAGTLLTKGFAMAAVAVRGLIAAAAPLAIVMGISYGIQQLIGHFQKLKEKEQELKTIHYEKINELKEQKNSLKQLSDEYNTLQSTENKTIEQKKRLLEIQRDLVKEYGVAATGINAEGEAFSDSVESINARTKELEEQLRVENEINKTKIRGRDTENTKGIQDAISERGQAKAKYENAQNRLTEFEKRASAGRITNSDNLFPEFPSVMDLDTKANSEVVQDIREQLNQIVNESLNEFEAAKTTVQEKLKDTSTALTNESNLYIYALSSNGAKISDQQRLFIQQIVNSIAGDGHLLDKQIDETKTNIDKLLNSDFQKLFDNFNAAKSSGDVGEMENIRLQVVNLIDEIGKGIPVTDDFKKTILSIFNVKITDNPIEAAFKIPDNLNESFEKAAKPVKELNQALDLVHRKQSLSAETVASLVGKYVELAPAVHKTANGYTIEETALEKVRTKVIQLQKDAYKAESGMTDDYLKELKTRLIGYGIELDQIKSRDDAINAAAKIPDLGDKGATLAANDPVYKKYKERTKQAKEDTLAFGDYLEGVKKLDELMSNRNYGVSSSSKSKEDDAATIRDLTKEHINAINAKADAQKRANEESEKRAKLLEGEEKYQKAIDETTKLLKGQRYEIDLLNKANVAFDKEMAALQKKHSNYNMKKWLDGNGEATEDFGKFINGLKSKTAQDEAQKVFDKYQLLFKAKKDNSVRIDELKLSKKETQKNIDDDKLKNTQQYLESRKKLLKDIDDQYEHSQKIQGLYKEGTKEYNDELRKQNDILSSKEKFLKDEINWAETRLKQGDLTKERIAELNEYLKTNRDLLLDVSAAQKSAMDNWSSSVTSLAKDTMSAIEDYYKKQGELAKKTLDDNLDAYRDFIDQRRRLLNSENATEDFKTQRDKLQNEAQEIRNKVNDLSRDTSTEGNYKRIQAEKELQAKLDEIAKLELDRSRAIQSENLDKLQRDKEIENKLEKDAAERKWQTDLQTDETYSKLKVALLQNNVNEMQSILQTFTTRVDDMMKNIGSSIDINLVDKMKMNDTFGDLTKRIGQQSPNPSLPNTNSSNTSIPTFSPSELSVIEKMKTNSLLWYSDSKNRSNYEKANSELGDSIHATYNSKEGAWYLRGVRLYHEGGEVGVDGTTTKKWFDKLLKSNELPAILKRGEVVLDSPIDFIHNLVNRTLRGISNIATKSISSISGNSEGNTYVTVQNLSVAGGQAGADSFFAAIEKGKKMRRYT